MRWVRPVITLLMIAGFITGFIMGKINSETFSLAVGSIVTYWFKSRDTEKDGKKP